MADYILVAEDDEGVRSLVESKLSSEMEGYEIVTAKDGDDAWEYLEEKADDPPELVVLDVMMPNLDGFSVLERIRESEDFEGLPVVMLTSRSREEDITKALEAGADDFIAKPFSPDELVRNVRGIL
jgi:sigma-B regulation protein RsbU (phosphoserine phosphatase)